MEHFFYNPIGKILFRLQPADGLLRGGARCELSGVKCSVVVLHLEGWERPTLVTFNECRILILISFLPPKIWGQREKCGNSVPTRSPSTTPLETTVSKWL